MSNTTWSKIYFGDYSKDGYEQGVNDYKGEGVKHKFRFFKALHPINYLWNFDNSLQSFRKNYNTGFEDTQKTTHQIYTTQNTLKGETMGLESPYNNDENFEKINTPKSNKNDFNYQISVAESLYKLFLQAKQNTDDIGNTFHRLIVNHDDLMKQFFDYLIDNHLKPRLREVGGIYLQMQDNDLIAIKGTIEKLNALIHGYGTGATESTKFFTNATMNLTSSMPSIQSPEGRNDYASQLEVMMSIKRVYQAFGTDIVYFGRSLKRQVEQHEDLMKEDFKRFHDDNLTPRLAQLKALLNNMETNDMPVIEEMIRRLQEAMQG
jgi:hypothetical protein